MDVPGTKDWNAPWDPKSANDSGVNVDAMAGNNTVLQQGIEQALRDAGAQGSGVPVMLVGHSQGGIVAAQSTNGLVASGYNVTHVVTAGSPVGRIGIPGNVQMLSLENKGDIVPHLDASDNPNTANRTTVTFENQTGTVGENHSIGGYRENPANRRTSASTATTSRSRDNSTRVRILRSEGSSTARTPSPRAAQRRK
ncbi:hypothetical protein ABZ345_17505 [Lentzea sp. NPDC005914]|uniref:lipase family protein n=1 Tax=Lentzea sp. NPDC005914 TaxID=3154572 RepID=UPI0033CFDED6